MLIGRNAEQEALRGLLDGARAGDSGTLILHGPAGSGKSALLDELAENAGAAGVRVLRAVGLEHEAHLPYAALGELLAPLIERRDELPVAQARALGAALALEEGQAVPYAVAAGTLSLLALAAEDQPSLVVVDDLQWIDEASRAALLFTARRLDEEGIALVMGLRDDEDLDADGLGLETLALGGLADADALELLAAAGLAPAVADALVRATHGSPLALIEVPPLLTDEQRSGAAPLEDPLPLGRTLDRAFRRRIESLAEPARRALVVAACAGDARADSVFEACAALDLPRGALGEAEDAGLVAIDDRRVVFCHPLQRSAALAAAGASERRAAHRALAAVLPEGGTEKAWQLAGAAEGAEATASAALAAAAADARTRGAHEEASRAFARAADLEPDDEQRARLLLEASGTAYVASRITGAVAFARRGAELARDEALRSDLRAAAARAEVRAGIATGGRATLVREGERMLAVDPVRAATFMLEASIVDMASGRMKRMIEIASQAADAARDAAPPLAFLADVTIAEAQLALGQAAEGDAFLSAAEPTLCAFEVGAGPPPIVGMAAHSSLWVERFDRAEAILDRLIGALREASEAGELIYPLAARSHLSFRLGRWPAALADAAEAVRLGEATGQEQVMAHALGALAEIEAALGHDEDARAHAARSVALAQAQGADSIAAYGHGALALLASGRRDPEEALERALAAERANARTDTDEPGIVRFAPDLLEALWRLGRDDEARERLAALDAQADRIGHSWTRAVALRVRGLLDEDGRVDEHFRAALELHFQTAQPFESARTRLLYGERLRRALRRADARGPLREALSTFERLGAVPWVERTRGELLAAGGDAPGAAPAPETAGGAVAELTPQELQIALHAARGLTNREVGAALFLAPKTVEHHLSRTFRKLGIRRRVELAGALGPATSFA